MRLIRHLRCLLHGHDYEGFGGARGRRIRVCKACRHVA